MRGLVWCGALLAGVAACGGKSVSEEPRGGSETGARAGSGMDPTGGRAGSTGKGGSGPATGGTSTASGGTGGTDSTGGSAAGSTSAGSAGAATAGMGGAILAGAGGSIAAGAGGMASGGSGAAVGVCFSEADCRVFDDCCTCAALGPDENAPACAIDCDQGRCATDHGVSQPLHAFCVAGRCVFDRSCDARNIACDGQKPQCPAGSLPIVAESCWTGRCLPATECSAVTSCDQCKAAGTMCVFKTLGLGPGSFHCVSSPPSCDGTCSCMRVCPSPSETCIDGEPITCYYDCITCG